MIQYKAISDLIKIIISIIAIIRLYEKRLKLLFSTASLILWRRHYSQTYFVSRSAKKQNSTKLKL